MARKKRGRKQARKIISKIRKAPQVKKASKPVQKAIRRAVSNNKGKKLTITRKEIKRIIGKGATRKQVQRIRKVAKNSKKLRIGKKIDQKKEVRKFFKKQRKAGNAPGAKNNIPSNNSGSGNNSSGGNNNSGGGGNKGNKGINIDKNVITPEKVQGKGWKPKKVEDSALSEWRGRFKKYKGPQRLRIKRSKLPSRLRKYSKYGKKTGEYKGFNTKRYMKGVRNDLRRRYKAQGGMIQDKDKINRMIKRDGPKANFNVKPKYSQTMDKLRDQLGGNVDYKKTLGSVTQSLGKEPQVKASQLKESGMSLLKARTTEDTAVPMTSTVKTEPPKKKKPKK